MNAQNAINSNPVNTNTAEISNVILPQSVSEILETPKLPRPQSSTVEVNTEKIPALQTVSEVTDILIATSLHSKSKDVDNLTEPMPESEFDVTVKEKSQLIPSDLEVTGTSNIPLPQSVKEAVSQSVEEAVEILNEATNLSQPAGAECLAPSPQSESEVVDNPSDLSSKLESEFTTKLNVPLQSIEIDSEVGDNLNVQLPQSVLMQCAQAEVGECKVPEVINTVITSHNQSNLEPVESLPTLPMANMETRDIIHVSQSGVESALHGLDYPRPESAVVHTLNASESIEETGKLKVPSAHSANSNSSILAESLTVPTLNKKSVQKYRKSNFEAIFDDDDDDDDTRTKLDSSLVEHTSVMRGAIPVLPISLAYFCLVCNVLAPGLGTIFSGMFCLCFGIPRFGVHDGAKHRIGSLLINLLVGCGQLFTVLFCLVGWGWSIWWGVIMLKISRKYRKLKAEAMAEEAEAPPVTANNHTRA